LFGEEGRKKIYQLKHLIVQTTQDETYEVRQLAVTTLIQFIMENAQEEDEKRFLKNFQDCMQNIYRVAAESVKQGDSDVLKNVIELIEECPKLFRQDLLSVCDFGTAVRI
jgi:hypothetical protein